MSKSVAKTQLAIRAPPERESGYHRILNLRYPLSLINQRTEKRGR